MWRFLIGRVLQTLLSMLVVISIVFFGFIPRSARLHQPNGRIDADCKGALLAMPPIGQAPVFGSVRID